MPIVKVSRSFFLFVLCALGVSSNVFSQESSSVELKFATLAPQSSAWGESLSNIRRELYQLSNRKIRLKIYWGGQMGDEGEMVSKISVNQLDGGAFTGNGMGLLLKESRVLELPLLFKDKQEVDAKYKEVTPVLQQYFKEKGLELVTLAETGNAYFFSKVDIKNFGDVAKSKMWLWKGDDFALLFFRELSIPGIPVSFTEVIPSLQTNLINGFYATPTAAIALQWTTQIKYMLLLPITNVTGGVVLNGRAWKKLSPQDQAVVSEVISKNVVELVKKVRKSDERSIDVLKEKGIIINNYVGDKPDPSATQDRIVQALKNAPGVDGQKVDNLYKILKN